MKGGFLLSGDTVHPMVELIDKYPLRVIVTINILILSFLYYLHGYENLFKDLFSWGFLDINTNDYVQLMDNLFFNIIKVLYFPLNIVCLSILKDIWKQKAVDKEIED